MLGPLECTMLEYKPCMNTTGIVVLESGIPHWDTGHAEIPHWDTGHAEIHWNKSHAEISQK